MRQNVASLLAATIAIGGYLALGFHQIGLPGVQYDEVADAVPAAELLRGESPSCEGTIALFGRRLPLMMRPHIGPTSTYLAFAAFALAGVSVATLRASQLLLGAVTLLLFWWLARRWFDDVVAVTAVWMLATAPPFLWWSRSGINWTLPLVPLALAFLLALTCWWHTRSRWALVAAAWFCGAGIATKILFIWLVPPLAVWAFVVLGRAGIRRVIGDVGLGTWVAAACALTLGLAPMLLLNLLEHGATFRLLLGNAHHTQLYGHDNLAVLRNLDFVVRDFLRTMQGNTGALPTPTGGGGGGALLIAACGVLAAECARQGRGRWLTGRGLAAGMRARLFLVLAVTLMVPASIVSPSGIGATYLFILLPFAWLAIAAALVDVARALARRAPTRRLAGAILACVWLVAAAVTWRHVAADRAIHRYLADTGGTGVWSDAVDRLAAKLESDYRDRHPIAMDWGLERNVTFLTDGRVRMREAFAYQPHPPPAYPDTCRALVAEPANLYAFHSNEYAVFRGRFEPLAAAAREQRKRLRLVETLRQRDGRANILLYAAEPIPAASQGP